MTKGRQYRPAEAADRRGRDPTASRVDAGEEVIVGVNRTGSRTSSDRHPPDRQCPQFGRLRSSGSRRRAPAGLTEDEEALDALADVARSARANLLAAAVEAARARATVGESPMPLRRLSALHRHSESSPTSTARLMKEIRNLGYSRAAREATKRLGHKPKIMVSQARPGRTTTAAPRDRIRLRRLSLRRRRRPLVPDAGRSGRSALAEEVTVIGVSSLAAGHRTLMRSSQRPLKKRAARTLSSSARCHSRQDYDYLYGERRRRRLRPGTQVLDAARAVLDLIEGRRRNV